MQIHTKQFIALQLGYMGLHAGCICSLIALFNKIYLGDTTSDRGHPTSHRDSGQR